MFLQQKGIRVEGPLHLQGHPVHFCGHRETFELEAAHKQYDFGYVRLLRCLDLHDLEDLLAVLELEEHPIPVAPLHQTLHNQLFWPLPRVSKDERVVHGDLPVLQHVRLLDHGDLPRAIAFLGRIEFLRLRYL